MASKIDICDDEPIESTTENRPDVYSRKPVEYLSNSELKNKICRGVPGGCAKCEVLVACRFGAEYLRRNGCAKHS